MPEHEPQVGSGAILWSTPSDSFPPLTFHDILFIRVAEKYTRGSGLDTEGEDLLLYRRPQLVEEWEALQNYVVNTHAHLWIMGPPGTGKSCAAFAFACSLDRSGGWNVLWIHCPKGLGVMLLCVWFSTETNKKTSSVKAAELHPVLRSLSKNSVVFLDGYASNSMKDADAVLETK